MDHTAPKPSVLSERPVKQSLRMPVDDPHAYCTGWAFHVPLPAFWAALDVAVTERMYEQVLSDGTQRRLTRSHWSVGSPPVHAFAPGDVFHSPPTLSAQWAVQLAQLTHTVQVQSVDGSTLNIDILHHRENKRETQQISQAGLAALLQFGIPLPGP